MVNYSTNQCNYLYIGKLKEYAERNAIQQPHYTIPGNTPPFSGTVSLTLGNGKKITTEERVYTNKKGLEHLLAKELYEIVQSQEGLQEPREREAYNSLPKWDLSKRGKKLTI